MNTSTYTPGAMRIFLFVFILCHFLLEPLSAQQLPYHTQYRQLYALHNPAAVNSDYFLYEYNASVHSSYRLQWISQPETPRTMHVSGEYLSNLGGAFELLGGAMMLKDRAGPQSLTGFYGRIASLFAKDPYFGAFSVGLSFGMVQYRIDAGRIEWADPEDPHIPLVDITATAPEIGLGVYYFKRLSGLLEGDNIYFGLSVPQLMSADMLVRSGEQLVPLRRVPHFYSTAGWYHFFNEDSFLEISAWAKYTEGAPFNLDLSGRFQPGRHIWAGGGFNLNGIVHLEMGLNLPGFFAESANLKIGYGFDYNISAFGLPFGSSHELNLSFMFDTYR